MARKNRKTALWGWLPAAALAFAASIAVAGMAPGRAAPGTEPAPGSSWCEPYVPLSLTPAEREATGFKPGGITPALLALLAGPRIALEWNDGRSVRTIELLRSVPYLGNLVGLYLCVEALSGYRMTAVASETGIDDWRRKLYFARIAALEEKGEFAAAARVRQCTPFDTFNHPPDPAAVKPPERKGFAKWKSGIAGLLIDNRVGLEREESRAIRTVEYWTILKLPLILPAIEAYRGRTMSEIVREEGLDRAWPKAAKRRGKSAKGKGRYLTAPPGAGRSRP